MVCLFFLKKVWGVDCQIGTPLPQEDGLQLFSRLSLFVFLFYSHSSKKKKKASFNSLLSFYVVTFLLHQIHFSLNFSFILPVK